MGQFNRHGQHLHALALQAFNEHLDIDAAGEFTGSGQLGNQHALIDSGHGIRIAEQREYRSADGVIHHKVPAAVEGSKGHVQTNRTGKRAHGVVRHPDGEPRVVINLGEEWQYGTVQRPRKISAQCALVKAFGAVHV